MMQSPDKMRRAESGQAMVEFALCLPLLMLLIFGIIYFGRSFYTKQIVTMSAQEGARMACRMPDLSDASSRDYIRGFTVTGQAINVNSPIYQSLAAGHLLSGPQGASGDLPPGSTVSILPWDDNSVAMPTGTVGVRIQYPFVFIGSAFPGNQTPKGQMNVWMGPDGPPVPFLDTVINEQAIATQEVVY